MKKPFEKNRRKKFFIDREIQLGITARFIGVFLIFIFFSTIVVFLPSAIKLLTGTALEELERPAMEFLILHKRIWPMVIIVSAGTIVYSIYFTHRIAGPIFRINREMQRIIEGDYPEQITLREKDYFKETASLLEKISMKCRFQEESLEEIKTLLLELKEVSQETGNPRVAEKVEKIEQRLHGKVRK